MRKLFLSGWFALIGITIFAQDVVQWRGDNRDGIYPCTGLLKEWPKQGPDMLWHFDELGAGFTSATVTNNFIYITGTHNDEGYLYALTHNGELVYKVKYGKEWVENFPGSRSTPLFYKGKLYFMSGMGVAYCFAATDGKLLWSVDLIAKYGARNLTFGITDNLLIYNNKVFVAPGGEEHNVMALNIETGDVIWSSKGYSGKSAYCSPLLVNHNGINILVTHIEGNVLAFDPDNGALLWNFEFTNRHNIHPNTPIYHNGMLFCFSGYGKGGVMLKLAPDGKSVSQVWENRRIDNQMGGAVLLNEKLYLTGHNNKKLYCVDWATGQEIKAGDIVLTGTTIAADGMLYNYAESGNLYLIKPHQTGFDMISDFFVPYGADQHWAHLVIHNKRLYVRHGTSLMVYNIANK
jgi:outer membrane protein assembly factor BamB